jgi:hypothetical protein
MSGTPEQPAAEDNRARGLGVVESDGRVSGDLACLRCGYNLRTLLAAGRCPECGTAVGKSLQDDRLRFCDPDWLARVSKGLNIIVMMIATATMAWVLSWFWREAVSSSIAAVEMAGELVWDGAALGAAIGTWLLTTPEPNRLGRRADIAICRFIRVSACGVLCAIAVGRLAGGLKMLGMLASGIGALALLAGAAGIVLYVRRLVLRIPDAGHANYARRLLWGLGIAGGLCLGSLVVRGVGGAVLKTPAEVLMMLGGCMFPCLALFWILFIGRVRRTFAEVARHARQTWAAPTPAEADSDTPPTP